MLFDYGVPVGIHPAPPEADDFEGYFSRNLLTTDLQTGLDTLMNTLVALGKAIDVQDWVRLTLSKLHLLVRKIGLQEACQNAPVAKLTPARDMVEPAGKKEPSARYNLFAMTCLACLFNEAADVPNRGATLVRKTPAASSVCVVKEGINLFSWALVWLAAKSATCQKCRQIWALHPSNVANAATDPAGVAPCSTSPGDCYR
eukprot:g7191.t1